MKFYCRSDKGRTRDGLTDRINKKDESSSSSSSSSDPSDSDSSDSSSSDSSAHSKRNVPHKDGKEANGNKTAESPRNSSSGTPRRKVTMSDLGTDSEEDRLQRNQISFV